MILVKLARIGLKPCIYGDSYMEEASIEGVHPSKRGSNGVGGVCVWGYSNLITPMTKATA